jgi:hypothetical protein
VCDLIGGWASKYTLVSLPAVAACKPYFQITVCTEMNISFLDWAVTAALSVIFFAMLEKLIWELMKV